MKWSINHKVLYMLCKEHKPWETDQNYLKINWKMQGKNPWFNKTNKQHTQLASVTALDVLGEWIPSSLLLPPIIQEKTRRYMLNGTDLYRNRDPNRMKPDRLELFWTGPRSRKKAWCSTAHFHKCLQALGWSSLKTKVCSCSFPLKHTKHTDDL